MKFKSYLTAALASAFMLSSAWQAHAAIFNVVAGDAASFQAALTAAAGNAEDDEIILPAGTYSTTNNMGAEFFYDSMSGDSLTIRGAGAGQTILDGASMTRVLHIRDFQGVDTIDHINVADLTIQNGHLAEGPQDTFFGGGLWLDNIVIMPQVSITTIGIENCVFLNNSIQNPQGDFGGRGGGAFFGAAFGTLSLQNNTFEGNQASIGGGISSFALRPAMDVSLIDMQGNQFLGNQAATIGGADLTTLSALIRGNNFEANSAVEFAGAMSISAPIELTLQNNRFVNNQATSGSVGGLWIDYSDKVVMTNSIFVGNQAGESAGAVQYGRDLSMESLENPNPDNQFPGDFDLKAADIAAGPGLTLTNNTISGNTAVGLGGGVAIFAVAQEVGDDVFVLNPTPINIYNNIIYGNTVSAGSGGDIFIRDTVLVPALQTILGATINLFNNDFSSFIRACEETMNCPQEVNQGNNINENPLFVDLANADVHLTAGSPAIDTGDNNAPGMPSLDYDGVARPFGSAPDMGALEAVPDIEVTPLNHNFGEVDVGDSESVEILIANVGVGVLTVSDLNLQVLNDITFDVNGGSNPCGSEGFELAGNESCTVTANFGPIHNGDQSNVLDVLSNDPDEAVVPVSLLGTTPNGGYLEGSGIHCSLNSASTFNGFAMLWMVAPMLLGMFRMTKRS